MNYIIKDNKIVAGINEILKDLLKFQNSENSSVIEIETLKGLPSITKVGEHVTIAYNTLPEFFYLFSKLIENECNDSFQFAQANSGELGLMLDASRNAVMKVEKIEELIRKLALMGYTYIELYTEDTYEVEGEEYFGYMRGAYTTDELKRVCDYAEMFGIDVVPCVQTLAHLSPIFRWNEYTSIKDIDDILLIGDERTYELIEHMLISLRKAFKTSRIHLGMDEAHNVGRGRYKEIHGDSNSFAIMRSHLDRVLALCDKYGFSAPEIWVDMFYRLAFGKYYIEDNVDFSDEVKAAVPNGLKLVYWDYYSPRESTYNNMLRLAKQLSSNVSFAGGAWKWAGYAPFNNVSETVAVPALSACRRQNINDVLLTAWGDNGAECASFAVLPSYLYFSELYHNGKVTELNRRSAALFGYSYSSMKKLDLPNLLNPKRKWKGDVVNPSKYFLYNDPLLGIYDKFVKLEYVDMYASMSRKLKKECTGQYAYLFETLKELTTLLSLKCLISLNIRNDYREGNVKSSIILIGKAVKALDRFHDALARQWSVENKAMGYEVLDLRLGGLKSRLITAKSKLMRFDIGEIAKIEELDIEPKKFIETDDGLITANTWSIIASASPI